MQYPELLLVDNQTKAQIDNHLQKATVLIPEHVSLFSTDFQP